MKRTETEDQGFGTDDPENARSFVKVWHWLKGANKSDENLYTGWS